MKDSGCRAKTLHNGKYGFLTVVGFSHTCTNKTAFWEVRCDCGTIKTVRGSHLTTGAVKSCGCSLGKKKGHYIKNLIGYRVGGLVVESQNGDEYMCLCDCGGTITLQRSKIIKGSNRSCGCKLKLKKD